MYPPTLNNARETVSRPGTCPSDLIKFDCNDLSHSKTGEKYVYMRRTDQFQYCWVFLNTGVTDVFSMSVLLDWLAAIDASVFLMCHISADFRNRMTCVLTCALRSMQYCTLGYYLWYCGTIGRLEYEVLQTARVSL